MSDTNSRSVSRRAVVGLAAGVGVGVTAVALATRERSADQNTPSTGGDTTRPAEPPGPPAPRQTPDGRLEVFDVTAFGAVGDGVTDNMEAFRNAQIAVRDNGGGVIYLPTGDYVSSPLPTDGPYLHLAQHLHDLYAPTRGPIDVGAFHEVFALYTSNTTMLFGPQARLLHPPFTLDGAGRAPAHCFIAVGGASNISILGGELVGTQPYADLYSMIGIWLRNAERVQIRNTRFTGIRADGIRVDEYHRWAPETPPDPQSSKRVVISGCTFSDCKRLSLLLRGASNVSIVGNTFVRSGGHTDHIASIDFEDHDTDETTMVVEHQRFVGNVVADTTASGVLVSGRNEQPGIVLAGNQLLTNGRHGASLGQSGVVYGNRASGNDRAGISFAGSRAVDQVVVANTLSNNGSYGLAHDIATSNPPRGDKDQRDNVVVANRLAGNAAGQLQADLARFDHDDLDNTPHRGLTTTNVVADNLEVS